MERDIASIIREEHAKDVAELVEANHAANTVIGEQAEELRLMTELLETSRTER